jgi:outer membrane biosynthesis protein TonB
VSSLPNDSSDGNTDLTAADQALAGLPGKRAGLSRPVLIGGAALLGLIAIVAVVRAFGGSSETPREKTSSISSVTPASGGNAPRAPSAEPTLEVDEPVQAPTETAAKSPAPSAASEQPLTVETAIQAPPEASVPVQQPAAMPRRPSAPAAPRTQPTPTPAPKPPSTSKQPFRPSGI